MPNFKELNCPHCKNIIAIETDTEIAKRMIEKLWSQYNNECYHSGCNEYKMSFIDWYYDWLDQQEEK